MHGAGPSEPTRVPSSPFLPLAACALAFVGGLVLLTGSTAAGLLAAAGMGLALGWTLRGQAEGPGVAIAARPEPDAPAARVGAPPAQALLETLPSPVLILSRAGRVVFANAAAHRALPRLQPGVHFANLLRAPAFVEAVGATLADGAERRFDFATHQGRERFFEARVSLLPADAGFGAEPQVIVLVEDRTEARRAEELRSDFIANASHELRTPLASIVGYIETLQNHARNDPEARERFLGIMAREAARMQRLVDDLMSLSRIELSEHVRPSEVWSLYAIAQESAAALVPLAGQTGATLDVALAPDGALVRCDRDQLAQVFANLIDNAVNYAGRGATIRVAAAAPSKAHPGRVGVTVSDDGPGIAREHVHRITERFYRVNVASSRTKGGTGLGLAIVKHILNRHEGRLEIVSTPGEGSAFTVWLPATQDVTQAAPRVAGVTKTS
jgi:two-component system phosphate regulon sensor histidine kinase PhoR